LPTGDGQNTATTMTVTSFSEAATSYLTLTLQQNASLFPGQVSIRAVETGESCALKSLPISTTKGLQISGKVESPTPIAFYVIPDDILAPWINGTLPGWGVGPCQRGPPQALIREETVKSYVFSLTFPNDGTYWFVFVNKFSQPIDLQFEAHSSSYATVTTATTLVTPIATQTTTSVQSQPTQLALQGQWNLLIAIAVVLAIVSFLLVFVRKKRKPRQTPTLTREGALSTGYPDLDGLLGGGIPQRYGVVVVSPAYDERDFLLRKTISTALSTSTPVFYLSSDMERTEDYLRSYGKDFYAFSPQADKIEYQGGNLYKIPGVENLSELNISFSLTKPMVESQGKKDISKIVILDILSDILLRHKGLITRKWLSDFIAKRKNEGFTTIATLNPLVAKEEVQTVVDLFDGVIEIYERELSARPRRFLIVKKLYAKKYSENELLLDRDKLFPD